MFMRFCQKCQQYTLDKKCPHCQSFTDSAHPARFSPDDKFSKERIEMKRQHGLLPSQRS
eukprot:TRINITY_DN2933_c2_g1_i1.p1 TRINITY_DN2933_c2_g1~~TRINITY_DN2933_c2_g1_i1.p1  ORF type:complete len:59 (+),score=14.11 TRINITY_DN2933_c2_g1_i1:86-262(+)